MNVAYGPEELKKFLEEASKVSAVPIISRLFLRFTMLLFKVRCCNIILLFFVLYYGVLCKNCNVVLCVVLLSCVDSNIMS